MINEQVFHFNPLVISINNLKLNFHLKISKLNIFKSWKKEPSRSTEKYLESKVSVSAKVSMYCQPLSLRKPIKSSNSKLIWREALKDKSVLDEYAKAMDILSREWKVSGDGISRIQWAENKIIEYFTAKRAKFIRRNPDIEE